MSFYQVEKIAIERKNIIETALIFMLENYPDKNTEETKPVELFKSIVSNFFLTDHSYDSEDEAEDQVLYKRSTSPIMKSNESNANTSIDNDNSPINSPSIQAKQQHIIKKDDFAPVQPVSLRKRLSQRVRLENEEMFMSSGTVRFYDGDDDQTTLDTDVEPGPVKIFTILFILTHMFLMMPVRTITMNLDILLVCFFSSFVIGFQYSKKWDVDENDIDCNNNITRKNSASISKRVFFKETPKHMTSTHPRVISNSMRSTLSMSSSITTRIALEADTQINGLLQLFPDGAELGSVPNCWSPSIHNEFMVRGANYLTDRVKIPSEDFILKPRGVELFLCDHCPANIGRYKVMLNQTLRKKPSFVINFRLPWGNCVLTSEIPGKFLPFLHHRYDPSASTKSPPSMDGMTPQEKCTCRFLLADDKQKSQTLKIIPSVAKGPWIVQKVANGKPAIIGSKMPTHYIYEPPNQEKGLCEYLEMDLDIVASSAARKILSVAQRYTETLTLDLGFVIQGNSSDELPEQMLIAMRLHSLKPLDAPELPEDFDCVKKL